MQISDVAKRFQNYRMQQNPALKGMLSPEQSSQIVQGAVEAAKASNVGNNNSLLVPRNAFDAMMSESRSRQVPITQIIDPGEMYATKSLSFNKYVLDFINDSGMYGNPNPYTDHQLLMAYMSSVYLFAALRRVSNLISRIKVVAEIRQGNKYVRAPETTLINRIFERDGSHVFSRMYLNYAIYGSSMAYKTKTLKAVLEHAKESPIYDYRDNAVAGLHVLDRPMWELDEDTYNGEIRGVYVQRGDSQIGNRNYLDRREFVYFTDWNPQNPNRGRSIATVAIHEAITNAAIARWSAEYFTRGAMPFVLVSMEEDPSMIADSDLMKYKRQFEEHWQGVNSSLRSVFIDRKVEVQQVGIPAGEVAADELNKSALEGISAAVGLDRELIVTPEGGSQERHAVLVKRAWEDTIIPTAQSMLHSFAQDIGLPSDMRLVLELTHIPELDADREEKVQTEMSVYNDGAQTFNEMRQRLNMPTITELDGYVKTEDGLMPIGSVVQSGQMPPPKIQETYANWYDKGLTTLNDYRVAMGMRPVTGLEDVILIDGKPLRVERLIQTLKYPSSDQIQIQTDMLDKGLRTFNEVRSEIGLPPVHGFDDVFYMDGKPIRFSTLMTILDSPTSEQVDLQMRLFEAGVQSINEIRKTVGLEPLDALQGWFVQDGKLTTLESMVRQDKFLDDKLVQQISNLWGDDLLKRSQAFDILGFNMDPNEADGYKTQLSNMMQFENDVRTKKLETSIDLYRERKMKELELEFEAKNKRQEAAIEKELAAADGSGEDGGGGGSSKRNSWRSFNSDDDFDPDDPNNPNNDGSGNGSKVKGIDGYVSGGGTSLYSAPSHQSFIIDYLIPDDVVSIDSQTNDGEWLHVYTYDNHIGWVVSRQIICDDLKLVKKIDIDDSALKQDLLIEDSVFMDHKALADQLQSAEILNISEPRFEISDAALSEYNTNPVLMKQASDYRLNERDVMSIAESVLEKVQKEMLKQRESQSQIVDITLGDNDQLYIEQPVSDDLNFDLMAPDKLYVALWLGNNAELNKVYNEVRYNMGEHENIEWVDPKIFHVTILYARDLSDEKIEPIVKMLPAAVKEFKIKCGPLMEFSNPQETIISLGVSLSDQLYQLQQKFVSIFNAYGVVLSEYSDPAKYAPHITLGYAPQNTPLPDMESFIDIVPQEILLMRDNYTVVHRIPIKGDNNLDPDNISIVENNDSDNSINNANNDDAELQSNLQLLRANWKNRLKQWQSTGNMGEDMPDRFVDVIKQIGSGIKSMPRGKIANVLITAIDNGLFDNGNTPNLKTIKGLIEDNKFIKASQSNPINELKAWEKKTLNGGVKKGLTFESVELPHTIKSFILDELALIQNGNYNDNEIKNIFNQARKNMGLN